MITITYNIVTHNVVLFKLKKKEKKKELPLVITWTYSMSNQDS